MATDPRHRAFGIAAAGAAFPGVELLLDIGRTQADERRKTGQPLTTRPVASGAFGLVKRRTRTGGVSRSGQGKLGVVGRDGQPIVHGQLPGDGPHLGMGTQALGIEGQLPRQIAGIAARERRREVAVTFTLETVAGGTSQLCPRIAARQRNQFPGLAKSSRPRRIGGASAQQETARNRRVKLHRSWNRSAKPAVPKHMDVGGKFTGAALLFLLTACKPAPDTRFQIDDEAARRGKLVAQRVQCGACHVMPGIDWPQGQLGPSLDSFDQRGLIAGTLPATPDNLANFIRNAPAAKPGTAMPAMPLSKREARDVAHYLAAEAAR